MSENNFLVIDDNEVFVGMFVCGFECCGYVVQQVYDKEVVFWFVVGGKFQFIIVDLYFGEDLGLSLIVLLCDLQFDVCIFVLIGYVSIVIVVQVVKEGVDNYFVKLVNVELILVVLQINVIEVQVEEVFENLVVLLVDWFEWEYIQCVLVENNNNILVIVCVLNMYCCMLQCKFVKKLVWQ